MDSELNKIKTLAIVATFAGAIIPFVGIALWLAAVIWYGSTTETAKNKNQRRDTRIWLCVAIGVTIVAFDVWKNINSHR